MNWWLRQGAALLCLSAVGYLSLATSDIPGEGYILQMQGETEFEVGEGEKTLHLFVIASGSINSVRVVPESAVSLEFPEAALSSNGSSLQTPPAPGEYVITCHELENGCRPVEFVVRREDTSGAERIVLQFTLSAYIGLDSDTFIDMHLEDAE